MLNKRRILLFALSLTLLVALAACKKAENADSTQTENSAQIGVTAPEDNSATSGGSAPANEAENALEPADEQGSDGSSSTSEQNGTAAQNPGGGETPPVGGNEDPSESEGETDKNAEKLARIDELVNQVYDLQASYEGQLRALESSAADEYLAIPREERTDEKKQEIALKYYGMATDLESKSDAQIDSICAELQVLIAQVGGDDAVVREIRSVYNSEKESLKADYMDAYGDLLG